MKARALLIRRRKHSDLVERMHALVTELRDLAHRILNSAAVPSEVPSHYQHDTCNRRRHRKKDQRQLPVQIQHVSD